MTGLDPHVGHLLHAAARLVAVHPVAAALLIAVPPLVVPLLFWVEGLGRRHARGSAARLAAPHLATPAKHGRAGTLASN